MTKSKNFWALTAFACLILAGLSGYSIYNRLAVHFLNDTVEIKPKPAPIVREPESSKPVAEPVKAEPAPAAAREEKNISKGKALPAKAEAQAAAPKSARAEEPKKQKAVKTLFEYKNASAKAVFLAGSFSKWEKLRMAKKNGAWEAEVYILPGNYLYHYVVDGKKTLAPGKPKTPVGESMAVIAQ